MKSMRVMLAEDNPVDALCLKEALEGLNSINFAITHVETLAEAKKRLGNEDFDAIVLDLGLPDSQGIETFQEAKNSSPDIPIVVLSGLDDETLAIEAVRLGAQDYLLKDKWDAYSLSRCIHFAIERKKAEKALKETQERFELALTGADLAWWEWNLQTQEDHANIRAAEILGYSPHEVTSLSRLWEESVHPDDIPGADDALTRHLQGEAASFETEYRARTKSGEWKWVSVRGKIVSRDPSGKPLRMAGTLLDITDRK